MPMNRTDRELVSASELAQLGYCERVAYFDWRDGAKRTTEQVQAQERGNAAHDRFYQESVLIARTSERKGRCFIATLALGECAETRELRAFRDLYLRRTAAGRWLIGAYYRSGPIVCDRLGGRPALLQAVRGCIRLAAKGAAWANARKLHR
jgi:hypothetical protein